MNAAPADLDPHIVLAIIAVVFALVIALLLLVPTDKPEGK